jgi:hypothetical protein
MPSVERGAFSCGQFYPRATTCRFSRWVLLVYPADLPGKIEKARLETRFVVINNI